MPRTAALRQLKRLSHQCAQFRADPGADASWSAPPRGRRGPNGLPLGRREFLAATVSLAATALAMPSLAAASRGPSVVIVGGGLAGLVAALTLADAGVGATLCEASTRLGGRISTVRGWRDGQTSESGGELFDPTHRTMLALARRFRLSLVDAVAAEPPGADETYYFSGQYYASAQLALDFAPVAEAIGQDAAAARYPTTFANSTPAAVALDRVSVFEWIETRVPGGHRSPLGALLDVVFRVEFGANTADQSALNLVYELADTDSVTLADERYRIAGGNDHLPQAIGRTLRATRLGWRLIAVSRNADGTVALTFNVLGATRELRADHVILAVPFAVLRDIDYRDAGFDTLKHHAIEQLGNGRNAKLQLQFLTHYWSQRARGSGFSNGTAFADTGFDTTWDASLGQRGASGLLTDYTGGDDALALETSPPDSDAHRNRAVARSAKRFLGQVEPLWPGIRGQWTGLARLSLPWLDPNFNASYAYWRVGQYHTIAGYEGVPQQNIHFAGEHCSVDFQGLMEGAATEGARAAQEVLHDLGKR